MICSQNIRPMKWIVLLICCVLLLKHSNCKQQMHHYENKNGNVIYIFPSIQFVLPCLWRNINHTEWKVLLRCFIFLLKIVIMRKVDIEYWENKTSVYLTLKYLIGYICLLWMIFTYRIHLRSKYVWLTQSNPSRQTHYEKFSFRLRNTKGGLSWEQKQNKPQNRSFCIFSAGATRKWRL